MALVLVTVVAVAVVLVAPPLRWSITFWVWKGRIRSSPTRWMSALGADEARTSATGPLLFRCGWPSTKLGSAFLVAFDESDLVVVKQGILRTTKLSYRQHESPVIRFENRELSIWTPERHVEIDKGSIAAIYQYLAACGWVADEPSGPAHDLAVPLAFAWPLPTMR